METMPLDRETPVESLVEALVGREDALTRHWHQDRRWSPPPPPDPLLAGVERVHAANFDLWHQEDRARAPHATDQEIARVKRAIDQLNQERNDAVEALDRTWLRACAGQMNPQAPLHSETPGMMADRLSILALKIFHTREQCARTAAGEEHVQRNRARLRVLEEQRADLARALEELLAAIAAGGRRFKLYRQMKMYNDPQLNPAIYGQDG